MSPLDPLGPILAQVRARALALKRKESGRAGVVSEEISAPGGSASEDDLMEGLAAAVAGISADVPDRRRKAFRLYMEAVLARELGVSDSSAAGFQDLLQRVLSSMEEDPVLRAAMERAGDAILSGARGRRGT